MTKSTITDLYHYYTDISPNSTLPVSTLSVCTITEFYYYRTGYYRTDVLRFVIYEHSKLIVLDKNLDKFLGL